MLMWKLVTVLCLIPTLVNCVQESDVKEQNLHEIILNLDNSPIDLDFNWMGSVEKWYIPIWNKLHAYRVSRDILKKDDLSENELKTSCLIFHRDGTIDGFGKANDFGINTDPKSIGFTTPWKKMKSRYSFKLTDNKSYIFGISSWMDGQMSWVAISTKPTLDSETEKLFLDTIKALGFDEKLAVSNTYENCQEVKERLGMSNEL